MGRVYQIVANRHKVRGFGFDRGAVRAGGRSTGG
jgi:hypothetical protein